jgi:hypothetical protein
MERVPGFVEEPLVVVQPALCPGDQMDDLGRVRRDHAGPRVLLRPVVEVEADVLVGGQVKAQSRQALEADGDGPLLRVRVRERREPPQVGDVVGRRLCLVLLAEDPVKPALAERPVRLVLLACRPAERVGERVDVDCLTPRASRDGIWVVRELRVEGLRGGHQLLPVVVEPCGGVSGEVAELVPVPVLVQDREHRLRGAKRERLAAEIDARSEELVLKAVEPLRELGDDDPAETRLAQAVETLALVAGGRVLLVAERLVLLAGEQVGVAGDDLRLLARLLLAHAHRACLLGPLVEIAVQPFLEHERRQCCCHVSSWFCF